MTPTIQSYEAHITIEPVFGQRFDEFESLCRSYGFRLAELLLMKSRQETPMRSNKDSFCTGHIKGLGRNWSWESLGYADDLQLKMFADPPDMPCMCADGDDGGDDA